MLSESKLLNSYVTTQTVRRSAVMKWLGQLALTAVMKWLGQLALTAVMKCLGQLALTAVMKCLGQLAPVSYTHLTLPTMAVV